MFLPLLKVNLTILLFILNNEVTLYGYVVWRTGRVRKRFEMNVLRYARTYALE